MGSQRAIIRQLRTALRESEAEVRKLQPAAVQGFEMQVTIACLLERLTDGGACVLPQDLRQRAFDEGWGYETMLVPGEEDKPMIVRLVKKGAGRPRITLEGKQ